MKTDFYYEAVCEKGVFFDFVGIDMRSARKDIIKKSLVNLTPPVGYALFYIKGVAGDSISTQEIYRGIIPFVIIIVLVTALLAVFPDLIMWLPNRSGA